MRTNRKAIAAVGVAAALIFGWGCGGGTSNTGNSSDSGYGEQSAPAGPATVALGAPVTVADGSATATVVVNKVEKAKSDNRFQPPPARGQFVAVTVEITATKGASDVGPSNFRFIGSDGTVYKAEILVVGIDPELDSATEIAEGQKKSGKVVFDCDPAKITGGKIQLSDDGGDPVGYWSF